MKIVHKTAQASHYDKDAKHYDNFNEENSRIINQTIEQILKQHDIKTVLDVTCGTGSQVFWLAQKGYKLIGSDINGSMLDIAKQKAKDLNLAIDFVQADMRDVFLGNFDAILSAFNAIGHLTKDDFGKAMQNIKNNLKSGGLYIFDIFNLDYLLHENNITKLTIDWQFCKEDTKVREIQYSTIDRHGTLASYTTVHVQKNNEEHAISQSFQTLQVYSAQELKKMLQECGFKVLEQMAIDGSKFDQFLTERILIVVQKG